MSCVGTQPCNPLLQDIGTGTESNLIQRTKLSHSTFPDELKTQYSPMVPRHRTDSQISTFLCEDGQKNSYSPYQTMSPDILISYKMFDLIPAESNHENFSLNLATNAWNCDQFHSDNTAMARFPSQDSIPFSLSNSASSIKSVFMLPGNFDDRTKMNSIECQGIVPLIEGQNYENSHYPEEISTCQEDSKLFTESHHMSNMSTNDYQSGMKYGINLSPDSALNDPKLSTHSFWDDVSTVSSPEILPRYDEWCHSPMISDSICFSSNTQASSPRFIKKYPDLVGKPEHSLVDCMNKMDVRSCTFGLKDVVNISEHPSFRGITTTSNEKFKPSKRSVIDSENVRTHPLYHNAVPQEDGLYHCPWENDPESNCQHKPEKLKCNYDKCVDSHLKPYQCKVASCKGLSFSSTACLLRHEREAHAMHGHGDKPFLCPFEGCDRGILGKGFPRRWNLRDHIKRVHKDPISSSTQTSENSESSTESSVSGISESTNCTKRRKRGTKYSAQLTFKAASGSSIVKKPKKSILIKRYKQKQLLLLETVKKLQDPKQHDNMELLRNANECIEVMVETTQMINSVPCVVEGG